MLFRTPVFLMPPLYNYALVYSTLVCKKDRVLGRCKSYMPHKLGRQHRSTILAWLHSSYEGVNVLRPTGWGIGNKIDLLMVANGIREN